VKFSIGLRCQVRIHGRKGWLIGRRRVKWEVSFCTNIFHIDSGMKSIWSTPRFLCGFQKTMEFHMKNLYEFAHFPCLGVQKRGEKKVDKTIIPQTSFHVDSSMDSIWSIPPSLPTPLWNFHMESNMVSIGSILYL
jgi:hypothetical protein